MVHEPPHHTRNDNLLPHYLSRPNSRLHTVMSHDNRNIPAKAIKLPLKRKGLRRNQHHIRPGSQHLLKRARIRGKTQRLSLPRTRIHKLRLARTKMLQSFTPSNKRHPNPRPNQRSSKTHSDSPGANNAYVKISHASTLPKQTRR